MIVVTEEENENKEEEEENFITFNNRFKNYKQVYY